LEKGIVVGIALILVINVPQSENVFRYQYWFFYYLIKKSEENK
jgi:hypothetical protein